MLHDVAAVSDASYGQVEKIFENFFKMINDSGMKMYSSKIMAVLGWMTVVINSSSVEMR